MKLLGVRACITRADPLKVIFTSLCPGPSLSCYRHHRESPLKLPCLTLLLRGPFAAMRKNSDSRLPHFSALNSFAPIFFEFKVTARHLRKIDEPTVGSTSTAQSSFRLPTKLLPPTHWSVLGCIMGARPPHI